MSTLRRRLDRRRFLAAAGAVGFAAGGVAPSRTAAADKIKLKLRHDVAIGPLLAPYVDDFNKRYPAYDLGTSYPPQDYFPTTQTQLAAGDVDFDVLFTDEGYNQKWYDNRWIRALDDTADLSTVLADIPASLQPSLRAADGKVIALPYYQGYEVFCYNAAHLDKIGATPPATWDEFVDTCRKLKKDAQINAPFSPFWTADFNLVYYEFMSDFLSESANPVFGEKFEPVFAADPAATSTLQRWQTLYKEGLVPQDIFTTAYGDIVNIFGGGQSSFTARYTAQVVGWKDPKQSSAAAQIKNGLMPGATHGTINFGGSWVMAAATKHPQAAWDLMKYFAWKDVDGQYYFCKHFLAIGLGLATAYDAVNKDPEVRASWQKWADVDLLDRQLAASRRIGPVTNQSWWHDFVDAITPILQDVARGKTTVADGLKAMADFVNSKRAA